MSALRSRSRILLIAGIVAFLVGASLGVASANRGHRSTDGKIRPEIGHFPGDINGDGKISDEGAETIPSMVLAVGDNGVEGYIRIEDMEGPQPANPEEAVEMMSQPRTIPVFAEDGVTIVDYMTVSPGAAQSPDPSPTTTPSG